MRVTINTKEKKKKTSSKERRLKPLLVVYLSSDFHPPWVDELPCSPSLREMLSLFNDNSLELGDSVGHSLIQTSDATKKNEINSLFSLNLNSQPTAHWRLVMSTRCEALVASNQEQRLLQLQKKRKGSAVDSISPKEMVQQPNERLKATKVKLQQVEAAAPSRPDIFLTLSWIPTNK